LFELLLDLLGQSQVLALDVGAPADSLVRVVEGELPADRDAAGALAREYADAGATWLIEAYWRPETATPAFQLDRVRSGPPRLAS